ncbi:MAG TPA: hypothetical protein VGL83_08020 [Stellaceae bacterium]|jgi:hypothetical protein
MEIKELDDAIAAARRIPYAPRELVRLAEVIRDGFVELEVRLETFQKSTADAFAAMRRAIAQRNPPVL